MPQLSDYKIFADNFTKLKQTSRSGNKRHATYMTQSSLQVVAFDKVKKVYCRSCHLSQMPESNDALLEDGKGKFVFVEFKDSFIDKSTVYNIIEKIYNSVLIFSGITTLGIPAICNSVNYVLVYNEAKNRDNEDAQLRKKQAMAVSTSLSLDKIGKATAKWAEKNYICFGLEAFKNYCFKEVYTFTQEEFEDYLKKIVSVEK